MSSRNTSDARSALGAVSLDDVVEALPLGALLTDLNGRIVRANGVAEALFSHRRDALVGTSIERWLGEDPTFGPCPTTRSAVRHDDGTELLVDLTISAIDVPEGPHMLVLVEDVTAQARLQERLVVLEAFADASDEAFFSQDVDGRIVTWSRSAERVFGFPEPDIVGRSATVLFPEHLRPAMDVMFAAVAAGEPVHHLEAEIQRRDGMAIPIALSMTPVLDPDGAVVGAVGIGQDITEMRLAQATLAEVEARLREGEALAHVGRWLWDVGSGAVQWSDEFHRIHGVDPLDFAGTLDAYMGCIHGDDRDRVRAAMDAAVASGRRFEEEYGVVLGDGAIRWVYAGAEPMMDSSDLVVGLRGLGREVPR
jgi:PAS domain S-box-containing protein